MRNIYRLNVLNIRYIGEKKTMVKTEINGKDDEIRNSNCTSVLFY